MSFPLKIEQLNVMPFEELSNLIAACVLAWQLVDPRFPSAKAQTGYFRFCSPEERKERRKKRKRHGKWHDTVKKDRSSSHVNAQVINGKHVRADTVPGMPGRLGRPGAWIFPRICSPFCFCFFAFLGSLSFALTRPRKDLVLCWNPNSSLGMWCQNLRGCRCMPSVCHRRGLVPAPSKGYRLVPQTAQTRADQ